MVDFACANSKALYALSIKCKIKIKIRCASPTASRLLGALAEPLDKYSRPYQYIQKVELFLAIEVRCPSRMSLSLYTSLMY